jgi:serine/threonine protein kinase/Tol biopolymer transport system component
MGLTAGTILGQYEIRSPLGAGGMGEVYRAHDTRLNREVAIKVLPESLTADPDRLRRFEQEARSAAALNHPNILAVYQMATHDGLSYMVTELLEGETLRERMRRGAIPLRKAIDFEVQIAHGLAAAHEKSIVHRDLKPENLFITKDGRVKILDFGLAKLTQPKDGSGMDDTLAQGTEAGMVVGTVGYMSPEQVRGKNADHRSDIFAFGTILYEMVTGKQTFRKPTSAETMTAILNEEPASISQLTPSVPPGLQRVVHRCLEKNPEQRFQSASDLAFALEALSDSAISSVSAAHSHEAAKPNRKLLSIAGAAAALVLVAGAATYFWTRPEAVPKVSNYVQLTHDGQPKSLVGTDGLRLYMDLGNFSNEGIAAISVAGGEPTKISTPSPSMYATDISPDGAELLVVDGIGGPFPGPLWSLPVLGGSPRRIGDIEARGAAWSHDGKTLAYTNGGMFLAKADGTESHQIAAVKEPSFIWDAVWSPDGSHLRFTDRNNNNTAQSLWEVSANGTDQHLLLPGWHTPPNECCGLWTADGKYFLFWSNNQIWALRRKSSFLRAEAKPVQLTSSPLALSSMVTSRDGKKLFVVGSTYRGELMRFDSKSGQFVSFLGGISADGVDFSKDGQWVTYMSFPDGALWRSKADGSERLQLTSPPNHALMPRWSPDGKKIVFFQTFADRRNRIFEISSNGGAPRQLLPDDPGGQADPNFSPGGDKIVFASNGMDAESTVRILNLASHQVVTLPESHGIFSPRWCPNGRYIVGLTADQAKVVLFDFQTQKWTELAKGGVGWPSWSKDGEYVYLLATGDRAVLKIRASTGQVERVADLKSFRPTGEWGWLLALAPDDALLLLRDAGTQDVYALDWEEP